MNKKFSKGGLVRRGKDDRVPILMQPGVTYVPRAAAEKFGTKCLQKINEGFEVGDLAGKSIKDLVLVFPGVSYVSKTISEKYGVEVLRELSGTKEIIVVEDGTNDLKGKV